MTNLTITDYHIHIRGGMTVEKAIAREEQTGIRSAVLENFGREWPLASNADLAAFLDGCDRACAGGRRVPVGIQVNDRDWFSVIDPALRTRLDFVLADSMIMGTTAEGKPRRLWLPDVVIEDPAAWMVRYLAHNLQILDEPISILANPTYLPRCIEQQYDALWTESRMRQVIAKAVTHGLPWKSRRSHLSRAWRSSSWPNPWVRPSPSARTISPTRPGTFPAGGR